MGDELLPCPLCCTPLSKDEAQALDMATERANICNAAFESSDGRHIPTEQIAEGLFWRMYDALTTTLDYASHEGWYHLANSQGRAYHEARALLSSLKVQQEGDG